MPIIRGDTAGKSPYRRTPFRFKMPPLRRRTTHLRKPRPGGARLSLFMLQDLRKLIGCKIGANDGDIGHVKDFYFDDQSWIVRYLVADTENWLPNRKRVLLAPPAFGLRAFGKNPEEPHTLRVTLNRKKIEDSPDIETHRPVSRQQEVEYYDHFGWPMYWSADPMSGAGAMAPVMVPFAAETRPVPPADVHLRSMREVTGYSLGASDGEIGKVAGFFVDQRTWRICEIAVETGHWYSGKEILVLPASVARISYDASTVFVNLNRGQIRDTARNQVVEAGVAAK